MHSHGSRRGECGLAICNQIANRQKHVKPKRHGRPVPQIGEPEINPAVPNSAQSSSRIIGAEPKFTSNIGAAGVGVGIRHSAFQHFRYIFEMRKPLPRNVNSNLADSRESS